ncbi:bacteriocin fulvocin C-related protein [Streptomyces coffeae]|uniref:Bacteriocin fulvocin C-related protein n=1 Tax=Streptomyces coffeae TaxID=621382 RepID=A0ABS1NRK5_9ACTN|nr:bacteriocin fulvocin C-related protein [Streptomyces coffeae]MBL1102658.1 bacteriocin fulvocin C-related protein [Streptomyces coffeae]
MKENARWILAFDASCATCRKVSGAVARAGGDRLEVLPLAHPDVRRLRERSLGDDAPWLPTLLMVRGSTVRAWTGSTLGLHLVRRLGPRSTVRVLHALGDLKRAGDGAPSVPSAHRTDRMGRAQFLRLGAGIAAGAGLVLAGRTPALAEDPACASARKWVRDNKDNLPREYADLITHPMAVRRAVFAELGPQDRSSLWVEHLKRYRAARTDLSRQCRSVLDEALAIASAPSTFAVRSGRSSALQRRLDAVTAKAKEAFGPDEARMLLATLGPGDQADAPGTSALPGNCECNIDDSWCGSKTCQFTIDCHHSDSGCGTVWADPCNGMCY